MADVGEDSKNNNWKARRKQQLRDELTTRALGLFRTKGIAATSVEDIVQAAGVAKGTFYLYFKSKSELLEEALQVIIEELQSITNGAVSSSAEDARLALKAVLAAQLAYLGDNPGLVGLLFASGGGFSPESELSKDAHSKVAEVTTSLYERIIRTGMLQAHYREVDAKMAAVVLQAIAGAMINDAIAQGRPLAGIETEALEILINGIKRPG